MKTASKYKLFAFLALVLLTTRVGFGNLFSSASDITPSNLIAGVNNERTQRNIPILNTNSKLTAAAAFKAQDMINRKYFAHVDPDGNYIWNKIVAEGYTPYTILGENLAIDFSDSEGLIAAWIDSPTHRENMLNSNFQDQGMGVDFGDTAQGQYSVAVANTFGSQPTLKPSISPTAAPPPAKTTPQPKPPVPVVTKAPTPKTPPSATIPASSPTTQPTAQTSGANIEIDTVKVTPSVKGDRLDLHISFVSSGASTSANATIFDNSVSLTNSGGTYSGDIYFQKYFNFQNQQLTLTVTDSQNTHNSVNVALHNIKLPDMENPKTFGNLLQKVANPDLYNLFKYIIIVFGIVFTLLVIAEFFLNSTKKTTLTEWTGKSLRGNHLILILLIVSTLLLVKWWH